MLLKNLLALNTSIHNNANIKLLNYFVDANDAWPANNAWPKVPVWFAKTFPCQIFPMYSN